MNFQINNIDLITEPTNHNWIQRTRLGYDGNAHPIYPMPRNYQLKWDFVDAESFSQLVGFFNMCSGTIQVGLPAWNSSTGGFASYNATLEEPSYGTSFEGFYGGVSLLVLNIH
jgi:hypothetical protein